MRASHDFNSDRITKARVISQSLRQKRNTKAIAKAAVCARVLSFNIKISILRDCSQMTGGGGGGGGAGAFQNVVDTKPMPHPFHMAQN